MSDFFWSHEGQHSRFPVLHYLLEFLKLMSIELMMPSSHLVLFHPLLFLPSIFPSIRIFSSESALCIRWPKYWSFSLSISLSSEYSRLISFKIDWFDLLALQGTLKSLLQHHSLKASVLQCSAFFMVQLSHPYTTTGKTMLWLYGSLSTNLLPGPYILSLYQEGYMTGQVSKSQVPRYKCQLRQKSRHI